MDSKKATLQIPQAYHHLLPDIIVYDSPKETRTTCDNCAMCERGQSSKQAAFYNPITKCCTYHPNLPNYAVGGILSDTRSEIGDGREIISARINSKLAVYPQGIHQPRKYATLYENGKAAFGHAESQKCPFFDSPTGNCSIWLYRDSVCSTWFCKHENGYVSLRYWDAVREYIGALQHVLVNYTMAELGFPAEDLLTPKIPQSNHDLTGNDIDEKPMDNTAYKKIWRQWSGREEEYYMSCWEIVRSLTRTQVEKLGGFDLELRKSSIENAKNSSLWTEIPTKLRRNPAMNVDISPNDNYLISAYQPTDTTQLPRQLFDLLTFFDFTETVEDAKSRISQECDYEVSDELLLHLCQHKILIEKENNA